MLKQENKGNRTEFQKLLSNEQKNDREELLKQPSESQEVKTYLDSIDAKLEQVLDKLDVLCNIQAQSLENNRVTDKTKAGQAENISTEPMGRSANKGRSEVQFIQNLLEK